MGAIWVVAMPIISILAMFCGAAFTWGRDDGWGVGGLAVNFFTVAVSLIDVASKYFFGTYESFEAILWQVFKSALFCWCSGMICTGIGVVYQSFSFEQTDIRPPMFRIGTSWTPQNIKAYFGRRPQAAAARR